MKKIILSIAVISAFIVYGLHQKEEEANVHVVAPQIPQNPTAVPANQTPTTSASSSSNPPTPVQSSGQYKDGTYTGSVADAFYGNIQVQATIQNGKITDVQFLQYPNDRGTSIEINTQAMPYLKQEAIAAQSANVDIVSGATQSSLAFQQSLGSALSQAK